MLNNISTYSHFLLERKQRGLLYHYTDLSGLVSIVDSNELGLQDYFKSSDEIYVSLTRDKNFHAFERLGVKTTVRITLNGDSLSDKYKVEPFTDFKFSKDHASLKSDLSKHSYVECEERVYSHIKDIKRYIIAIDYIPESTKQMFYASKLVQALHPIPELKYLHKEVKPHEYIQKGLEALSIWLQGRIGISLGKTNPTVIYDDEYFDNL